MTLALENVSVVAMKIDRSDDAQTVVVDGDRITWVGPASEARLARGVRRVDGRGRFLMPGLADMHTHPMTEADLLLFVAFGVTTIRNMWGLPRHLAWRDRVVGGDLLAPTIHTAGPIVDGRPVTRSWSRPVTSAESARRLVAAVEAAGYEAVKVYNLLTLDAYGWLVDAARDHGLPVVGHVPFSVGLHRVLDAGQRSIEHLYGYIEALQPGARGGGGAPPDRSALLDAAVAAHEDLLPDLARATREAGTWNCPTLVVRRRYLDDTAALWRRADMKYLTPTRAACWRRHLSTYSQDHRRLRFCELQLRAVKSLSDEGAGLLVGTDSPVPMVTPGASVHDELEAFVLAGLTPFQALRAATADAARFMGQAGEWGTVEIGARADLLLLDANPLVDVANVARIAGVMARGRWLPGTELRDRLDDLAAGQVAAGPPLDEPDSPDRRGDASRRIQYRVQWDGRHVGHDELILEPTDGGGYRLGSRAGIELFGYHLGSGFEAGSYRATVDAGGDGRDSAATFELHGADGVQRIEMTRDGGTIRVRSSGPGLGSETEFISDAGDVVMASPLPMLYTLLGLRLRGLAVGGRAELRVVGPGLPPDFRADHSTVRVERLPGPDQDEEAARYSFELVRSNAAFVGVMTCDASGLPVEVELRGPDPKEGDAAPTRVTRMPDRG